MLFSVLNFKAIRPLKWILWANEISRELSLRWLSKLPVVFKYFGIFHTKHIFVLALGELLTKETTLLQLEHLNQHGRHDGQNDGENETFARWQNPVHAEILFYVGLLPENYV